MITKIKSVLFSSSVNYVVLRYVTYFVQFVNSFLLAKYLDMQTFGIYGFVMLVLQYISYMNLGISESLNTEFALKKNKTFLPKLIWECSWSINLLLSILLFVAGFAILYLYPDIFSKYRFSTYGCWVILLGIAANINKLYSVFYRLHGKLFKLNVQQLLPNLLVLVLIFIYKSDYSIRDILLTMLVGNLFSIVLFRINLPLPVRYNSHRKINRRLLIRGINLLIYSLSFSLITVLANTLVSFYYPVEDMGIYSYANTLSNAVVMAGGAFLFIFYPKMIYKFGSLSKNGIRDLLIKIKHVYVLGIDILTFTAVLFSPLIPVFLPGYEKVTDVFCILMAAKIIINSSSGYSTFLIAKSKENVLTLYGAITMSITFLSGVAFIKMGMSLKYMAVSIVFASFVYAVLIIKYGYRLLDISCPAKEFLKEILSNGRIFGIVSILTYSLFFNYQAIVWAGFLIYLIFNREKIRILFKMTCNIVADKKALDF